MPQVARRVVPFALLVMIPAYASGDTIISGGNILNEIWTPAGSPYIVQGDITIPAGAFLTIQPGTEVRISSSDAQSAGLDILRVELTVRGTLSVNGTSDAPVRFHAQGGTNPMTWVGIVIENTATSVSISQMILSHASAGIRAPSTPGVTSIADVTLTGNNRDLTLLGTGGAVAMNGRIEAGAFIGNLTIPSPATLALNRNTNVLQVGNFVLDAGASLESKLTSIANYERLQVQGTVGLSGSLSLDVSTLTASPGDAFALIENDDFDAVSGQFAALTEGAQFVAGAYSFQISYQGGDGNDVVVTVQSLACDLAVTKSGPLQVEYGDGGISYMLSVSNVGPGTASTVVVIDSLPSGLRYESAVPTQGSCLESGNEITCNLGDLLASANATVAITTSFDLDTLEIVNAASASSQTPDANGGNNSGSASTMVLLSTTAIRDLPVTAAHSVRTIPNPVTYAARIFFAAPQGSDAEVRIFNVAGRHVRTLSATLVGDQGGIVEWDGRDSGGAQVGAGVFLYELKVNGRSMGTNRVVIVR